MKALTLTQPWASLVAIGAKKIETRSWSTKYRGPLAIHAAKGFPKEAREVCGLPMFSANLFLGGYNGRDDLPLGMVVATCQLMEVQLITHPFDLPANQEITFGDYTIGRYMWYLADVRRLAVPVPAKGMLGLWEWAGDL